MIKLSNINLNYKNDLIYYECPILSHFKDDLGNHYFAKWSGVNYEEWYNKWLVFYISVENLKLFFNKQLSLLQLIELSSDTRLININDNIELIYEEQLTFENIDKDYLPSEKSHYREKSYEPYSNNLKQELNESK